LLLSSSSLSKLRKLAERLGVPIVMNEASASAARDRDKLLLWFADADVDGNKRITLEQFRRMTHKNLIHKQMPITTEHSESKHKYIDSGEAKDAAQNLVFAVGRSGRTVETTRGSERARGRDGRMSLVGFQSDLYSPTKGSSTGNRLEPAPHVATTKDREEGKGDCFEESFANVDDEGNDKQIAALHSQVSASVQDVESQIQRRGVTSGSILDDKHNYSVDVGKSIEPRQVGAELLVEAHVDEKYASKSSRKSSKQAVWIDLNRLYATELENSEDGSVLECLQKKVEEIAEEAEQELERNLRLRKSKEIFLRRHREELAEHKMRCLRIETQVRLLKKHKKATYIEQQQDVSDAPNAVMLKIERHATKNAIVDRPAFSSRTASGSRRFKHLGKVDMHSASRLMRDPAPKRMSRDARMKFAAREKLHTPFSPPRKLVKPKPPIKAKMTKKPAFHC